MPKIIFPSGGSGGAVLTVQEEGVDVQLNVNTLNFVGAGIEAVAGGAGIAIIYSPTPTFASHFNTTDGTTDGLVAESGITRSTAYISSPTVEGTPFKTGGWAGSNQSATIGTTPVFAPPDEITAMNDCTFTVTVFDADGISVLEAYTTPVITGNSTNTSGSGFIVVTVSSYAADTSKFKGDVSVSVQAANILAGAGLDGGRYSVRIVQTVTDGTGPYTYNAAAVFYDTNGATPTVSGSVSIAETGGSVVTKHLSGIEYYTTGSSFTATVVDIDAFNTNTARTSQNLRVSSSTYGTPTNLNQSPLPAGTGNANFSGWTSAYDVANVDYTNTVYNIDRSNFRYFGTSATISARGRDTWAFGVEVPSSNATILVDTYGTTSSALTDAFDDEAQRQESDYTTAWTSSSTLTTSTTSTCEIEVVDNGLIQVGDTLNLVDNGGVTRTFIADTDFTIAGTANGTASNIATAIQGSGFFTAVQNAYAGYGNFATATQLTIGTTGNQTNSSSRPAAISMTNFVGGGNGGLVQLSYLQVPSAATLSNGTTPNANWAAYEPDAGGANPDYTGVGAPVSYFRTITDSTGLSRSSLEVTFTSIYNGAAVTDFSQYLQNDTCFFFVRKVGSSNLAAITGKTIPPMRLHGDTYSSGTFNQGKTFSGSYMRVNNTATNTVQGTFGGVDCQNGFYLEILINNALLKINQISVTFI